MAVPVPSAPPATPAAPANVLTTPEDVIFRRVVVQGVVHDAARGGVVGSLRPDRRRIPCRVGDDAHDVINRLHQRRRSRSLSGQVRAPDRSQDVHPIRPSGYIRKAEIKNPAGYLWPPVTPTKKEIGRPK